MLNFLLQFDTQVTDFIYQLLPHNQAANVFFQFLSLEASFLPIWIIAIIILLILEAKTDRKFLVYLAISLLITAAVVFGLKNTVQRPRPAPIITCGHDFAFPSGHASISFAAVTVLAHFDKKRKWLFYLVAVLISLSRIYLQCHYFLDVISGALIGYAISQLIFLPRKI